MKTSSLFICLTLLALFVSSCNEKIDPIILTGSSTVVDYQSSGFILDGENLVDDFSFILPLEEFDPYTAAIEHANNVFSFEPSETIITNMKVDFFRLEQIQSVFTSNPDFLDNYLKEAQLILQRTFGNGETEDVVVGEYSEIETISEWNNPNLLFEPVETDLTEYLKSDDYNFVVSFEFLETQQVIVLAGIPHIKFTYDFEVRD